MKKFITTILLATAVCSNLAWAAEHSKPHANNNETQTVDPRKAIQGNWTWENDCTTKIKRFTVMGEWLVTARADGEMLKITSIHENTIEVINASGKLALFGVDGDSLLMVRADGSELMFTRCK